MCSVALSLTTEQRHGCKQHVAPRRLFALALRAAAHSATEVLNYDTKTLPIDIETLG